MSNYLPIHVNVSALRAYYSFLDISPPFESYAWKFSNHSSSSSTTETEEEKTEKSWRLYLGDIVAIRTDETQQNNKNLNTEPFPFKYSSWCPAEIICIYRQIDTKSNAISLRSKVLGARAPGANKNHLLVDQSQLSLQPQDQKRTISENEFMLEVRWVNMKCHLPSKLLKAMNQNSTSLKTSTVNNSNNNNKQCHTLGFMTTGSAIVTEDLENVVETDLVDDCSSRCILAPVQLHDGKTRSNGSTNIDYIMPTLPDHPNMPTLNFFCYQFYSANQYKSGALLPFGDLSKRIERGRMYSRHLSKDLELKTILSDNNHQLQSSPQEDNSSKQMKKSKISLFQDAIKCLTLSQTSQDTQIKGIPLICREKEQSEIKRFLESTINRRSLTNSLFISGPPGTGKTASVLSAVAQLRREQASHGKVNEFDFVLINAMELHNAFDAYVVLWENVSDSLGQREKCSPGIAASRLERYFGEVVTNDTKKDQTSFISQQSNDKKRKIEKECPVTILLLDEIDYLVTEKQTVLYNLFDWPMRQGGQGNLVIIGISNTINLPDILTPRVQSRLSKKRCVFSSYSVTQIVSIIQNRLSLSSSGYAHDKDEAVLTETNNKKKKPNSATTSSEKSNDDNSCLSIFESDAIMFAARKTAAISGDIRRAFQTCRFAAEKKLDELEKCQSNFLSTTKESSSSNNHLIKISDIQSATREMFNSRLLRAVSLSTPYQALVFVSLASLKAKSNLDTGFFTVDEILVKMDAIANASGKNMYQPIPSFCEFLLMLNQFEEAGLITLHSNGYDQFPTVELLLEEYDIQIALRDTKHRVLSEKFLGQHMYSF